MLESHFAKCGNPPNEGANDAKTILETKADYRLLEFVCVKGIRICWKN